MTLFELMFFAVMIAMGVGAAKMLYPIGGLWFAIPGFLAGGFVIPFAAFMYHRYRKRVYLGDKHMPICSCGSDQYIAEKVGQEYHLLCRQCRTHYERRRDEVFVYDKGGKRLFKRLVKYQGWV